MIFPLRPNPPSRDIRWIFGSKPGLVRSYRLAVQMALRGSVRVLPHRSRKAEIMFGLREPSHWLLLILVVVILFGAKRLPDSARSLGRSLRIFKSEVKELNKEDKKEEDGDKSSN